LGSKTKVAGKLNALTTLTGCAGLDGAVTGGSAGFALVWPEPPPGQRTVTPDAATGTLNCSTLFTPTTKFPTPVLMTGKELITWNTKATSTISVSISPLLVAVKGGSRYTVQVNGTVTAGLFKGQPTYGTLGFAATGGACTKVPMGAVTVYPSKSNSSY